MDKVGSKVPDLLVIVAWLVYVLFYLCRVDYSIAFPYGVMELGLDYCIMGVIAGVFTLGQIVSGCIVTRRGVVSSLLGQYFLV